MKNVEELNKLLTDFETGSINQTEFIIQMRLFVKDSNNSIFGAVNPLDNLFNLDTKTNLLSNLDTLFFSFLETNAADDRNERENITVFYKELKTIVDLA